MPAHPRARSERLVVRELADELLVYDLERHAAVCLNRTAAAVWRRADGATAIDDIARGVAAEVSPAFDASAVWCALDGLEKRNLVDALGEVAGRPRRTRREWLRELGQSGLAAGLIPAVLAVVAPSAAEAASYVTFKECFNQDPDDCSGKCLTGGGYCLKVFVGASGMFKCFCVA